jgi:hypothetical protein
VSSACEISQRAALSCYLYRLSKIIFETCTVLAPNIREIAPFRKFLSRDALIPKSFDEVLGGFGVALTRVKAVGVGSPRVAM